MAQSKKRPSLFTPNIHLILDAIGVIFVWRGIWMFTDRYLFPDHPDLSALVCIILGLIILYIENKKLDELR